MKASWTGRQVLVTGGAGFIGSHLVERLLADGARVRVLDAYNSFSSRGHLEGLDHPALSVHLGDVADSYLVSRLTEGIDVVFHLAALIGIPYSYVAPAHYVRTNVNGALAVLEAARHAGVERVVHTSTSETFGSAQYVPMDETHPVVAQSPYAATKLAADQMASSYHRSFGLPLVTLRPFNTYGPRQSLRAVLPTLMAQALYADAFSVGSLSPVRDMNYVDDTVEAFVLAGSVDGVDGETFNVGSGRGLSIGNLLERIRSLVGCEDKPVVVEDERVRPPDSEVDRLVCDYSKANKLLGYEPHVDIDEGLRRLRDHLVERGPTDAARYYV